MNVQGRAQSIEPGVRLYKKENDIAEKEELEGFQVKLSSAGEVLGCEQAGPG
jgi:hypothetical protein